MLGSEQITDLVMSDPRAGLAAGKTYLDTLGRGDNAERSATLRALSLGARFLNDLDGSIEFARQGAEAARAAGSAPLEQLNRITMAGSLAQAGDPGGALTILDEAIESQLGSDMRAKFEFQRGFVLGTMGRPEDAVESYQRALPIFRETDDKRSLGMTLHNLGGLHTQLGEFDLAEEELTEAMRIERANGEISALPGLEHNLGRLAAYQGDIPRALQRLLESDEMYMDISGARYPQHVTRCEVLISVGLFREALSLARSIVVGSREVGDVEHEVDALLVAAAAAQLAGEPTSAATYARETIELVGDPESAKNHEASRILVEAELAIKGPNEDLLSRAGKLAEKLDAMGLLVPAGQASLLAARIALALGDEETARATLGAVAEIKSGPFEMLIQSRLARAWLARLDGEPRKISAAVRSGLSILDDYQATLGATDLRMGIEKHGAELAAIGLDLAVESRRPRRVLEWLDRSRARALQFRAVLPEDDANVRALLSELRRIESDLRRPDGGAHSDLRSHRLRLQDEIAQHDRTRRGASTALAKLDMAKLIDDLGPRTLLEIGESDGALIGVLVEDGRAHYLELGDASAARRQLSHVRFAMRRSALRGREFDASALESLDQAIFGDLYTGGEEIVLVPPPALMAVPWAALPHMKGRVVSLSPSAQIWRRARRRPRVAGRVVLVGGPDLEVATYEIDEIGRLHQGASVMTPDMTVEHVLETLPGSRIAHFACHASLSAENPMFSSLRLGDGDLNVYDIERLTRPPGIVVLSACDSGFSESTAGNELAGLTSALLTMGTRSVVASIGLVPDSSGTADLMIDLHDGLTRGLEPARALTEAQQRAMNDPERFVSAASFVAVGA